MLVLHPYSASKSFSHEWSFNLHSSRIWGRNNDKSELFGELVVVISSCFHQFIFFLFRSRVFLNLPLEYREPRRKSRLNISSLEYYTWFPSLPPPSPPAAPRHKLLRGVTVDSRNIVSYNWPGRVFWSSFPYEVHSLLITSERFNKAGRACKKTGVSADFGIQTANIWKIELLINSI